MNQIQILDAAIFAQAHLEEPLSLQTLAGAAGMSPHHFQRAFAKQIGETPAAYVQRLRLEKAAFRLLLHDDPIICVALDCGYANHETMTRAFRRLFGVSPREYRRRQRFALASGRNLHRVEATSAYELSATRIVQLRPLPIAFIRTLGPYEDVDPGLWAKLNLWADGSGQPRERTQIGIGHDAPGVTAPERLRFDACITVPADTIGDGDIRVGALPALLCAVTSHIGSYATLPAAYPRMFARAALPGYEMIGLPAIEFYRDASIEPLRAISCTDVYLPIQRCAGG